MDTMQPIATALLILLAWGVPVGLVVYGLYAAWRMPLRRKERARLLLTVMSDAVEEGHSPEHGILRAASSRDPSLGVPFHLLAAHVEAGLPLAAALNTVPKALPVRARATVQAGLASGQLRAALAVARDALRQKPRPGECALQYAYVMLFVIVPVLMTLGGLLVVWVLPRFSEILRDMTEGDVGPAALRMAPAYLEVQFWIWLVLAIITLLSLAGPPVHQLVPALRPWTDRLAWLIPWRRKQMQRHFVSMLTRLMDHGVPEADALGWAGCSVGNTLFEQRVDRIVAALKQGASLAPALEAFAQDPEMVWRLRNALHAPGQFVESLRGWMDSLEARAERQEELAGHLLSTALILMNGAFVIVLACGTFGVIIRLTQVVTLW